MCSCSDKRCIYFILQMIDLKSILVVPRMLAINKYNLHLTLHKDKDKRTLIFEIYLGIRKTNRKY